VNLRPGNVVSAGTSPQDILRYHIYILFRHLGLCNLFIVSWENLFLVIVHYVGKNDALHFGGRLTGCSHKKGKESTMWGLLTMGLWYHVVFSIVTSVSEECITFTGKDGSDMFLQNVGSHRQDSTASQPRRPQTTFSLLWKPQLSQSHSLPLVLAVFYHIESLLLCHFKLLSAMFQYRSYVNK
jgi:hypothetical protein